MPSLAILYNPGLESWQRFTNPVEEVEVFETGQLLQALEHIETRVEREGLYAAGFVSYEAASAFDEALQTLPPSGFPLLRFGLFTKPEPFELPSCNNQPTEIEWRAEESEESFACKVETIRAAIARGETYQVNLTFPLYGDCAEDPWQFFLKLVHGQQPVNCGFLQYDRWAICSASPELFFARDGKQLIMRPMKGTAPRGRTPQEDRHRATQLEQSEKNRAENIMILDMVRNDLGRLAPPGEVRTEAICTLEKYPTVWQLTSTATATSNATITETFKALFPCASITGAPKAKTMQTIREIESQPRNIYTGTFGWMAPDRKAHFSIAIRTAMINLIERSAVYGVGAGITWDSQGEEEYRECLDKAAVLTSPKEGFSLIETFRWTPTKGYFILDKHLQRLRASADYFDFAFDRERTLRFLDDIAARLPAAPQRVRLLLHRDGQLESSHLSIEPAGKTSLIIRLADRAIHSSDVFLYHKTTRRGLYEDNLADAETADEVLLWNERGEVTEGCTTNLVVKRDNRLVTPAISCGLLAGTYRDYLIDKGVIEEDVISKDELLECQNIYLINAVRKWRRAEFPESTGQQKTGPA